MAKEKPKPVKLPEVCSACGQKLTQFKWNDKFDILICENPACSAYRNSVGNIKKEGEFDNGIF